MASDWNLLVICRKAHEFFKYWRCQPGIECSNVTRISKNEWENDIFHFNVVQWNPFHIRFNLLEVECPVDFDDGNRSMRENWMIWIKIECESTHEWRNFIVTLRHFFTYVNIASTEPTIDKLKMKHCQILHCFGDKKDAQIDTDSVNSHITNQKQNQIPVQARKKYMKNFQRIF